MIIYLFFIILGFYLLMKGADIFVEGASNIALNFNVSKRLIGLTIVSFCTSAPELAVSFKAIISGNNDIMLGNVIGSNIINILLILGICSIIRPILVKKKTIKFEMPILLFVTIVFIIILFDSYVYKAPFIILTRYDGIILLFSFFIFLFYLYKISYEKKEKEIIQLKMSLFFSFLCTILGIIIIIIGSNMVVKYASIIAKYYGMSERIVSLTIIALGTSLPELVTSLIAIIKKENEIAIGNIIGSNIFNICVVIGLPLFISGSIKIFDISFFDISFLLISVFLLVFFSYFNRKIDKIQSIIFIMAFIIYYSIIIFNH